MIACVAEGGESCLTSGDRREPEDSDVYIKNFSPRSALPSEGEEECWRVCRFPRVSFSHPRLSIIRRLRRRYTSNQFCAFCRMTRSVYTLCGFKKFMPVGFCVFGEFCGSYKQRSYKQRNHKYKWGCRLNIIRSLYEP